MRSPGDVVTGPDPGVPSGHAALGAGPGGGADPADGASPVGGARAADGAGSADGAGPADGDGWHAGRERGRRADRPVDCVGGTAQTARSPYSPSPASGLPTAVSGGGSVAGWGTPTGRRAAAGRGEGVRFGDGDVGTGGDGGAGSGGRQRGAPVAERVADWPPLRPARDADGVRHRFGGDIRQFVKVHSKSD